MQTLKFTYTTDGTSAFHLELTPAGSHITNNELVLMGKYIQLLFATIRQIGAINNSEDIDAMIRDLLRGDDA